MRSSGRGKMANGSCSRTSGTWINDPAHSQSPRLSRGRTPVRVAAPARLDIAQSTVAKYMSQRRGARSPGWQAFLRNHTGHIAGIDLFPMPVSGIMVMVVAMGVGIVVLM